MSVKNVWVSREESTKWKRFSLVISGHGDRYSKMDIAGLVVSSTLYNEPDDTISVVKKARKVSTDYKQTVIDVGYGTGEKDTKGRGILIGK